MRISTLGGLTILLLTCFPLSGAEPTHEQIGTIDVAGGGISTFCLAPDGRLLVVGPAETGKGRVRVYSADGEESAVWSLPFTATAINISPAGEIFVAGTGQVARLDADGKILQQAPTPQIGDMHEFREQVRAKLLASMQSRAQTYEKQLEAAQTLVAKLSETPEANRSAIDKLRLKNAERQVASLKQRIELDNPDPASIDIEAYVNASLRVPGLAVSDRDVFIAVSSLQGYGYDVWRTDHNFSQGKRLVEGLRGCCGQMDIQCSGGDLYVAENSRHRVVRYDRDGNEAASWGKADRTGKEGFEGCCNPMNLRFGSNGEVLTAESGCGAIKRYSPQGEFLGLVGNASLVGGCKHVALAATSDADRIYMLDITRSRIAVLAPVKATR